MTDDAPSRDTSNTSGFSAISDYDGLKQNADGHNTLGKKLDISALLLSRF